MAKHRVTLTELAAEAGVTVGTIRYRVQRRQMTPPNAHGLFDRRRALAELAAKRATRWPEVGPDEALRGCRRLAG